MHSLNVATRNINTSAGIGLQLWEVMVLATRYAVCDPVSAPYSWAAEIRWPALLRELGVTPDSHLPAGHTASLKEVADLLSIHPPDVRCLPLTSHHSHSGDCMNAAGLAEQINGNVN